MVKFSRPSGWDSQLVADLEARAYRAGLVAGALALVAVLGAAKDLYALLSANGRGQLALGFLLLRYSRLEQVWFGYRFTGQAAVLAMIPHIILSLLAAYGLITRRRWGWYLVFVYVLSLLLAELAFAFLPPLGWLPSRPSGQSVIRTEWFFLPVSLPVELLTLGLLWRYRDLFER